ncbi:unnamed protein product [Schistosoma turkestanicum]|nr:unnamed protein product [Schistosoma turkestanicum]
MATSNKMDISQSLIEFSEKLYAKILEKAKSHSENTFLSPFNVYTSLGMILSGSAMNTKDEIVKTMQLSECLENDKFHGEIGKLLSDFSKPGGVEIKFGNGIFFSDNVISIKERFRFNLMTYYNASTERLAFQTDKESACKRINQWVSKQTCGKIQQLVSSQSLTEDTSMLMLATTYYKGVWKSAFPEHNSYIKEFHGLDMSKMEVKYMFIESSFDLVSLPLLKSRAIKIPFKDPNFLLLVILPDAHNGLPDLLKSLSKDKGLSSILLSKFENIELHLHLPKFKLKEGNAISLTDYLKELGMKKAFCPATANFSNISDLDHFCISNILHKAILEVDEHGVVAAAATAIEVVTFSAALNEKPKIEFRVDHPFFISILWKDSIPIFLGHVTTPMD